MTSPDTEPTDAALPCAFRESDGAECGYPENADCHRPAAYLSHEYSPEPTDDTVQRATKP